MIINQGKDTTLDPYYFARPLQKNKVGEPTIDEERILKIEQKQEKLEGKQEELEKEIEELNEKFENFQETGCICDPMDPIPINFIENLNFED